MTPREVLNEIAGILSGTGIENPREEAFILLEDALRIGRSEMFFSKSDIGEEDKSRLFAMVKRRLNGEPLQYITGLTYFMGLPFYCEAGVLIPRQDTERLCEKAIEIIREKEITTVLDLCAGSGCIGLSIAKLAPSARVSLLEKYDRPLELIRKNAENLGVLDRVQIVKGDVFDLFGDLCPFDMIVSNPPYIRAGDMAFLEAQVKNFEPESALDGGEDGLLFYREIAKTAKKILNPGGHILFEIGMGQGKDVSAILQNEGLKNIAFKKDYGQIVRVVSANL